VALAGSPSIHTGDRINQGIPTRMLQGSTSGKILVPQFMLAGYVA
jgi:hypothetical protein